MLTLFSYPDLCGVADNNPYGLKVYAFLKLCNLAFRHEHIFDASNAPRGQLPYVVDGEETIGDSDAIIGHLMAKYSLTIDDGLTSSQRDTDLLVRRMLDYTGCCPSRVGRTSASGHSLEISFFVAIPASPRTLWQGRANSISSAIIIKESAAMSPTTPMQGVLPISAYLQIFFPEVDICLVRNRTASMREFMGLLPTSVLMRLTRR